MKNIEVKILNPEVLPEAEKMASAMARLTQQGHTINSLEDFMELYEKPYKPSFIENLVKLPHPTLQKFGVVNVAVIGASRRFLAQITRHQNEVKFMSASLQYSDYTDSSGFVIPYEILKKGEAAIQTYLETSEKSMQVYKQLIDDGVDNDAAGYLAPQGLRNVLIISATPYQLSHMINQRACSRNTRETQYVMLKIWDELLRIAPALYSQTGPYCMRGPCPERHMACNRPMDGFLKPRDIIRLDYPLLYEGDEKQDE